MAVNIVDSAWRVLRRGSNPWSHCIVVSTGGSNPWPHCDRFLWMRVNHSGYVDSGSRVLRLQGFESLVSL